MEANERIAACERLLARNNVFALVFDASLEVAFHTLPARISGRTLRDFEAYVGRDALARIEALMEVERKAPAAGFSLDGMTFAGPSVRLSLYPAGEGYYALQIVAAGEAAPASPGGQEAAASSELAGSGESAGGDREALWQDASEGLDEVQRFLGALEEIRRKDGRLDGKAVAREVRDRHLPRIEAVRRGIEDPVLALSLDIIEKNLRELLAPEGTGLPKSIYARLTPSEIQIAEFIRMGKSSKDIADALDIASKTVENHRNSLREKLGIKNRAVNLRSYLMQLGEEG